MRATESEVKTAIVSIISHGLLQIRGACRNHPDLADAEAYHLHNLPQVLKSFSVDLLRFYVNIERPDYLQTVGKDFGVIHEADRKIIDDFLAESGEQTGGRH